MSETLVERLRKRAEIRRQISTRKSVQEGKPDRIADVLEESANRIEELERDGSPGVMHEVDEAFYRLTVKERDFYAHRVGQLVLEVTNLKVRQDALEKLAQRAALDFGYWFNAHGDECEGRDSDTRAPEDTEDLDAWEKENCDCFLKLIAELKEAGEGK